MQVVEALVANVGRALEGKRDVIERAVVALLARGHLLIEDVPGVGKTTLARALARSVDVSFRRVQFTSDLMPADVLGGSVLDPSTGTFTFHPGPIFGNVFVADEINRATPKTQSALLEAMEERQVSLEGNTYRLEEPFFVVATQNPRDFYGTYPLPESQLDRFLLRTEVGYPPAAVERHLLRHRRGDAPVEQLNAVVDRDALLGAQQAVDRVHVEDVLIGYIHAIVLATRSSPLLEIGASTRAALALEHAARAHALVARRDYALPDDVKGVATAVLGHRVRAIGEDSGAGRGLAVQAISEILATLPIPV